MRAALTPAHSSLENQGLQSVDLHVDRFDHGESRFDSQREILAAQNCSYLLWLERLHGVAGWSLAGISAHEVLDALIVARTLLDELRSLAQQIPNGSILLGIDIARRKQAKPKKVSSSRWGSSASRMLSRRFGILRLKTG
jgi:hypothetical protein